MQNYVLKLLSFYFVIVVKLTNINMVLYGKKKAKGRKGYRLEVKYKYKNNKNYVGTMTDYNETLINLQRSFVKHVSEDNC